MAKSLLITVVVILTAFAVNEVIGAARHRRDTAHVNAEAGGGLVSLDVGGNATLNTSAVNATIDKLKNNTSSAVKALLDTLRHTTIKNIIATINGTRSSLNSLLKNATAEAKENIQRVITALDTLANTIESEVQRLRNQVVTTVQSRLNNATRIANQIVQGLSNTVRGITIPTLPSIRADVDVHVDSK